MKIYKYCLIICSVLFLFSCEKETEGLSTSTHYVAFDIKGDNPMLVPVGTSFTDPGVVATEMDKEVTRLVTVQSNVDPDVMGKYSVIYTAVNSSGLKSRAIRDVFVCNPEVTTDISGTYTVAAGSHRVAFASGAQVAYSGYPITITRVAPGFFSVSDFFGGYYDKRAGYGARYAMTGYIALNEDNTIDLVLSSVTGWGDSLDELNDGVYDPATGTVSWGAVYAGAYSFNVILIK